MSSTSIKLGLMPPLTGIVALYGDEISQAGKIACEEINQNGGVLGKPLELIILDDGSLPETAVYAANRLIDEFECVALIGNLLSNSRIAVSSLVSEPRQIPYLNFSFYEGSISGRYFFHFAALPNQQIDKMIPYMAKQYGAKMFFAGNNYEWPRGSIDAAKRILKAHHGEIVGEQYLPIGATIEEIQDLLNDVANSGADVFVPYFAGIDQINLLNLFTEMGLKKRMAVVMGYYDEILARELSAQVREGFYSCNTYFMTLETQANQNYLKRLAKQKGITGIYPQGNGVLTNFGEATYLCVHAFAKAVNEAQSTNAQELVLALENISIQAPQGQVLMDKITHHAIVNTFLSRCNAEGTFEIIENFGQLRPMIPERYKKNSDYTFQLPNTPSQTIPQQVISKGVMEILDIAVIATDEQGTILQTNKGAGEIFGYGEGELEGMSVHSLVPPHIRAFHVQAVHNFVSSNQTELRMGKRGEISGYRKDGTFFPAEAGVSKFKEGDDWVLVVTLMDVSSHKKAQEELVWRATHDALTSLPNRALIKERLENALERSLRSANFVGLLFIDLDKFKLVNDTYGHNAGDQLLINVAKSLSEHVRPGDTVARLGGDEFVILCENIESNESLIHLAQRINNALRVPLIFDGKEIVSTASIGLALGHGDTHSAADLLRESDTAMYASKQFGRDSFRFFTDELHENARHRLELEMGLRNAIEKDELKLLFQPIVSSRSNLIVGMEALIRWHNAKGIVSPAIFIPIAEESGLIIPIGYWVFRKGCEMQAQLQKKYPTNCPYISVNVSAKQLDDNDIIENFKTILIEEGANPNGIILEITESSIMTDVEDNLRVLNALCALGMKVAVDDFGTGYSSFSQLLRMPVSYIKIDKAFVDGIDTDNDSRLVTSAIIKMAKTLDKKTIAEGVENEQQLFELRVQGADNIQGFYFFRPMEKESIFKVLSESKSTIFQEQEIYTLIYLSHSSANLQKSEIEDIVRHAQKFNGSSGITGYLLYDKGYFLQLLEGRKQNIDKLMQKITLDKRHSDITAIMKGYRKTRLFVNWSMGYWSFENKEDDVRFENIKTVDFSFKELAQDPQICYAIFKAISKGQ
jgi:diguanylate cyclase (GGDEF)-like protein/PAS domain S-box-containing protein